MFSAKSQKRDNLIRLNHVYMNLVNTPGFLTMVDHPIPHVNESFGIHPVHKLPLSYTWFIDESDKNFRGCFSVDVERVVAVRYDDYDYDRDYEDDDRGKVIPGPKYEIEKDNSGGEMVAEICWKFIYKTFNREAAAFAAAARR